MANDNYISPASLESIDYILHDIQVMAITIKTLSHIILEGVSGDNDAAAGAHAVELIASQIGFMTDEGLGKLNRPRNDASAWFLSPALQNIEEHSQAATA